MYRRWDYTIGTDGWSLGGTENFGLRLRISNSKFEDSAWHVSEISVRYFAFTIATRKT